MVEFDTHAVQEFLFLYPSIEVPVIHQGEEPSLHPRCGIRLSEQALAVRASVQSEEEGAGFHIHNFDGNSQMDDYLQGKLLARDQAG